MDIRERIIKCIALVLKIAIENVKEISGDQSLQTIGMDSLTCVDIIVNIEQEFGFCLEDDLLLMEYIDTINKLTKIVAQKVTA